MARRTARVDRSTLRLSEVARHVVVPDGIVDTLWFAVEARCREFGDSFDVWQDGLGQIALGLRADGTFAATVGGVTLSIPRQVAKTFIVIRIVVALATMYPNLTILWTAHRARTSSQTFGKMRGYVQRKAVRKHLAPTRNDGIRAGNGEQEIAFRNGSKILFGAREAGFGRGFDEIDIEVFDEAQILTEKALEDMVAATNQSRWVLGALLFFMGTPPRPIDPGEEFTNRRRAALAGKPADVVYAAHGDGVYVECSADPGCGKPGGPALEDRGQVAKANPSYPHHTPEISIARLRAQLTNDDSWRREALGIWDEAAGSVALISPEVWGRRATATPPPEGRVSYGVKFSADGAHVALAAALRPQGGPVHVEVVEHAEMARGMSWLVAWLAERAGDAAQIVVDGKAYTGALVTALRAEGVPVRVLIAPTADQVVTAHGMLLEAVTSGRLTHFAQPALDETVAHAEKRPVGRTGGWAWRGIDGADVTPLDAVTLAHWAALTSRRRPGRKAVLV